MQRSQTDRVQTTSSAISRLQFQFILVSPLLLRVLLCVSSVNLFVCNTIEKDSEQNQRKMGNAREIRRSNSSSSASSPGAEPPALPPRPVHQQQQQQQLQQHLQQQTLSSAESSSSSSASGNSNAIVSSSSTAARIVDSSHNHDSGMCLTILSSQVHSPSPLSSS